jgi:hypothetical protein
MGFFDKLFGQKDWAIHVAEKDGFQVSYPQEWVVREVGDGLDIHPPTSGRMIEPGLGVEVPIPGVRITVRELSGGDIREVKDILRARSDVYENYRVINHISNDVPKADQAVLYEFGFAAGGEAFQAVSMIARRGNRLYDARACERAAAFETLRKTLRQIVKSFKIE